MAAVSAGMLHHRRSVQSSIHEEQTDEESNDESIRSPSREKPPPHLQSPEYKISTSPDIRQREEDQCPEADSPKMAPLQTSSFSMHNVLKMKSERDSASPPCQSNSGVFSTEKLLENTPNYIRKSTPLLEEDERCDMAYSEMKDTSFEESREIRSRDNMHDYRDSSEYVGRNNSPIEEEEKVMKNHQRIDDMDEENSCCSEDTVLSVGNEQQIGNFDSENRTSSTANSQIVSPRSSPVSSPASTQIQNLSSFKHIQSHLTAISQLSQNLHSGQHMLLRPNPIAPNPLLFLNQNRLLFNPHHPMQPQMENLHQNHHSLSNSPTSINPAMPRVSPNEISPNSSGNPIQLSPSPPGCESKLNLIQNLSSFAVLGQQMNPSLRYYKQSPFGSPGTIPVAPNMQALTSGFGLPVKPNHDERMDGNRRHKSGHHEKAGSLNGNVSNNNNQALVNERLYAVNNGSNITNHINVDDERHNLILNHNGLKFSIDNILKADFGRRITDPLHKRSKSSSSHAKHKFGAAVLNPLNSNSLQSASKHHQVPMHHHNATMKDPSSFGGKSGGFLTTKEINSNAFFAQNKATSLANASSNIANQSSASSSASSRLSSERLSAESRIPSISDLKSGSSLQNNLVTSSSVNSSSGSSEKTTGATGAPIDLSKQDQEESKSKDGPMVWPAWVYCTRYSDRPSSGPRTRRPKKPAGERSPGNTRDEEKRPRTAFSGPQLARLKPEKRPRAAFNGPQLARLKHEFAENRYLTERRRQQLSAELGLNEAQIKIWFQNKRAKIKKASGQKNPLALQLMAQGLYNHSTVPLSREEEELQELHAREGRDMNT